MELRHGVSDLSFSITHPCLWMMAAVARLARVL